MTKHSILHKLATEPLMRRWDLPVAIALTLLWIGLVQVRPWVSQMKCAQTPTPCTSESVFVLDRPALGLSVGLAEENSLLLQNIALALAFVAPLLVAPLLSSVVELSTIATDGLIMWQAATANGSLNELTRLIVQRPRPYVYSNTAHFGLDVHSYTSFYSGHTSGLTVVVVSLLLLLIGRGVSLRVVLCCAAFAQSVVLLMAISRVLSGRHFPTDTVAGALAGASVALIVALIHRAAKPRTY